MGVDAFNPNMWKERSVDYGELGWVGSKGLLQPFLELTSLNGKGNVVDLGTGTGAVAKLMATVAENVVAVDVSVDMLNKFGEVPDNVDLRQADITCTGLDSGIFDVATARMVFHHLNNERVSEAIVEALRLLRDGGRFIVSEYVVPDEETRIFEREVFDLKEKGRQLWTPNSLEELLQEVSGLSAELMTVVLREYSVNDWLGKSGLGIGAQEEIKSLYYQAPETVCEKMGIVFKEDDIFVDRPFSFVWIDK